MTTTIMLQGTGSDVGKSILSAALGRIMRRQGYRVAPFKPQNMALNSFVTQTGGEIGRAQAVQALACGIEAHTDMNPVLLKPNSETGAQVIIHGQAIGNMDAVGYHQYKSIAMEAVLDSYRRLIEQFQVIIVEGAGSPAEINLRERDIANMGFAEAVDCDVILVADIDKGGVFAQIVGTLELLSDSERQRIKGFIINKFRGDISLLQPGLDWLEEKTSKPVLAVMPYLHDLYIDAEDAISNQQKSSSDKITVVIPVLPRISNHNDFDPLRLHPEIDLQFIPISQTPPAADLIILPGSKNVRADLQALFENSWDKYIQRHCRYGGKLIGICGGYQMLGTIIHDPEAIEGPAGSSQGLNYLPISTTLAKNKQLRNVSGHLNIDHVPVSGYEIHAGVSQMLQPGRSVMELENGEYDGMFSEDDQVLGTYLHGLFDRNESLQAILKWSGIDSNTDIDYALIREEQLDKLCDHFIDALDHEKFNSLFSTPI